jgi:hypothetical protein
VVGNVLLVVLVVESADLVDLQVPQAGAGLVKALVRLFELVLEDCVDLNKDGALLIGLEVLDEAVVDAAVEELGRVGDELLEDGAPEVDCLFDEILDGFGVDLAGNLGGGGRVNNVPDLREVVFVFCDIKKPLSRDSGEPVHPPTCQ